MFAIFSHFRAWNEILDKNSWKTKIDLATVFRYRILKSIYRISLNSAELTLKNFFYSKL